MDAKAGNVAQLMTANGRPTGSALIMDARDRVLLFSSWDEALASVDSLSRVAPVALSANAGKPSAAAPAALSVARVAARGSPDAAQWVSPSATSTYDEALLVTNVQKAVRRQLSDAAARSAAQYLRQVTSGTARRELLRRAPIVAAEDAAVTPLLAPLLFAHLTATTLPPLHRDIGLVIAAYAQMAAAPRDEEFGAFCRNSDALGAQHEGFPPLDDVQPVALGLLCWVDAASCHDTREARRESAALVLLLHIHASCERRPGAERTWLAANAHMWRARAAEGSRGWSDAKWAAWRAAHVGPVGLPSPEPPLATAQQPPAAAADGARESDRAVAQAAPPAALPSLLPLVLAPLRAEDMLFYSADYHSRERMEVLGVPLAAALGASEGGALRMAMSEHCLRNVRDAPLVHALTCRRHVPVGSALARQECFLERWAQLAAHIWRARPCVAPGPGGKGAGAAKRPFGDAAQQTTQKSIRSFFGGTHKT